MSKYNRGYSSGFQNSAGLGQCFRHFSLEENLVFTIHKGRVAHLLHNFRGFRGQGSCE